MEASWLQLWIGVLAGVMSTTFVFMIRFAVGRWVAPVARLASHERNLTGNWQTKFNKTLADGTVVEHTEEASLYQIGSVVYGKITNHSRNPTRFYKMRGSLREGVLVATYETTGSDSVLDRGAFTLRVLPDGTRMAGHYAWTDDETNSPSADLYTWTRN